MIYKCVNSFTSANGKHFHYGDKIKSYDYSSLRYSEQSNFKKEDEEDGSSIFSPPSFDFGSPDTSSTTSSNDFGGGEFGGGGAGGDW